MTIIIKNINITTDYLIMFSYVGSPGSNGVWIPVVITVVTAVLLTVVIVLLWRKYKVRRKYNTEYNTSLYVLSLVSGLSVFLCYRFIILYFYNYIYCLSYHIYFFLYILSNVYNTSRYGSTGIHEKEKVTLSYNLYCRPLVEKQGKEHEFTVLKCRSI